MATAAVQSLDSPIIVCDNGFTSPPKHRKSYTSICQGAVYVDTCALADPMTLIMYRLGLVENAVILRSVSGEITRLLASPDLKKQHAGQQAALALATLHSLPRVTVVMDSDEPTANHADPDLIKHAWLRKGCILTADIKLQEEASSQGVDIIDINAFRVLLRSLTSELVRIFPPQPHYTPGNVFLVRIDRLGEKNGQGVGFLEDGRMVIVSDGARHLGEEVEVVVQKLHKSSPDSELVFAQTA